MENKVLIAVIIALVLVVAGLTWYILFGQKGGQPAGAAASGGITSAHFETFPAGTELKQGMQGNITDEFRKGDLVGISGETNITGTATLTFQILDGAGNVLVGAGPGMTLNGAGGFGMCCFNAPATQGDYVLKLLLDGKEARTMPFKVLG